MNNRMKFLLGVVVIIVAILIYFYYRSPQTGKSVNRTALVLAWLQDPEGHPEWKNFAKNKCQGAVFSLPTGGFIGYLWDDSFYIGHNHTGIDVFSGLESGIAPIYAVYDGYLTRKEDWKSTVVIRIPEDPLQPGRQIWTYYTHMADSSGNSYILSDFPPGTTEVFVHAGDLLGYQGNYSGTAGDPTGVHLHFSIVKDDGSGVILNELKIENTLDPSEYFGMSLNANMNRDEIPFCSN